MKVEDLSSSRRPRLTGRAAERAVAIDLLKNHSKSAPSDLRSLKTILDGLT